MYMNIYGMFTYFVSTFLVMFVPMFIFMYMFISMFMFLCMFMFIAVLFSTMLRFVPNSIESEMKRRRSIKNV